jgi:DNA-binding NtrC family response regulator
MPYITELYEKLLTLAGYIVKTFNDRLQAMSTLKADERPPLLLITDYRGRSMPICNFIESCRMVRPGLRILMASGFSQAEMRFFGCTPDRFIQKPFSAEELGLAVEAALATR